MPVRETSVWRVQSGGVTKWFWEERDARQHVKDRYDIDLDGIPYVAELTDREMIAHLNNLEAKDG